MTCLADKGCRVALEKAVRALELAGIDRPVFESELLLAHALGATRLDVIVDVDRSLADRERSRFEGLIERRRGREPLAYIRGRQEFYGRQFEVGPGVLVPRPETEMLVDFAIEKLGGGAAADVVDFGAGTGCIGLSVAAEVPQVSVAALDLSKDALGYVRRNASNLGLARRLDPIRAGGLGCLGGNRASMILSNPPYVPTAVIRSLQPEVRDFEPRMALDGGADGLDVIRLIVRDGVAVLRPGGWLALEVGQGQAEQTADFMRRSGYVGVSVRKDLAGIDRVVVGQKPC